MAYGDGSMVRGLAALSEDPSLVPSTHVRPLTNTHNSGYSGSSALFWAPQARALMLAHTHAESHTHIYT